MDRTLATTRTYDLGYEQLLTFVGRPGTRVRVLYGSMWLTEEGREQDIFAACGDEVTLKAGGVSVIEGLGAARVQLIEPGNGSWLPSIGKRVQRVVRAVSARIGVREVFARSVFMLLAIAVSAGLLHLAAPGLLTVPGDFAGGAQSRHSTNGAASKVLADVAAAGTGFLAVN